MPPAASGCRAAKLLTLALTSVCVLLSALAIGGQASAQENAAATQADAIASPIGVELNKLETVGKGCRAYVVVNNPNETAFKTIMLELYMFRTDGVIGRRFALDIAPLREKKRAVKLFDLANVTCDQIGSFLINDVLRCESTAGEVRDCLDGLDISALTKVTFSK